MPCSSVSTQAHPSHPAHRHSQSSCSDEYACSITASPLLAASPDKQSMLTFLHACLPLRRPAPSPPPAKASPRPPPTPRPPPQGKVNPVSWMYRSTAYSGLNIRCWDQVVLSWEGMLHNVLLDNTGGGHALHAVLRQLLGWDLAMLQHCHQTAVLPCAAVLPELSPGISMRWRDWHPAD